MTVLVLVLIAATLVAVFLAVLALDAVRDLRRDLVRETESRKAADLAHWAVCEQRYRDVVRDDVVVPFRPSERSTR